MTTNGTKSTPSTPMDMKKILPKTLTGSESSLAEKRWFLSFFYQIKDKKPIFYELNAFGSRLHRVEQAHLKVYQEINASIMCLLNGQTVEEEVKSQRTMISHIHSICMLILLEKLFLESYKKGDSIIDQLHTKSPLKNPQYVKAHWLISSPLLLVQAIRFSQWESDNQDYCIEFFSARRSREYMSRHFDKWFNLSNARQYSEYLYTFARLIRWHTLEGQHHRGTATFGIEKLSSREKYLTLNEKTLLYIFAALDALTREQGSSYEWKVTQFLSQQRYPEGSLGPDILTGLKSIQPDWKLIQPDWKLHEDPRPVYSYYQGFNTIINEKNTENESEDNERIIYSYTLPAGMKKDEIGGKYKEILNAYKSARNKFRQKGTPDEVSHISVDRNQRALGLLNKILAKKIPKYIGTKFKCVPHNKALQLTGALFPQEYIFRIAYHPEYVVETLYGLKNITIAPDPVIFLKEAFKLERAKHKDMQRISLPMVKRITDLLSYYTLRTDHDAMGSNHDNANYRISVFPLRIIFDHGKAQFDVWLPELQSEMTQVNELVDDNTCLTVTGILVRYIHALVSNYGMTCQYNHVDLDFSASRHFQSGSYKWHTMLVDPRECPDCKESLGLQIFDQYLTQVGIEKLETSYSMEKYLNAIERRNATRSYSFDKSSGCLKLDDKYVLGIDIGATGIKLKFYKIKEKVEEGANNYTNFVLSEQPTGQNNFPINYYYLTPAHGKGSLLEFSMPTLPPEKAGNAGNAGKYEDAAEFARYIVNTLSKKLSGFNDENKLHNECFENLLSIGFCWPGPIRQNTPASTSGILNNFKGFTNRILENDYAKIVQLDLATAVKNIFEEKRKSITKKDNEGSLTVALQNDGDVEAAGLAFGMLNGFKGSDVSKRAKDNSLCKLFRDHSVVVIKAGTGTAGAFLDKGEIKGLNEFGKLIVNLGADNRPNVSKQKDQRWPVGDANKFFSIGAFSEILKGVPAASVREVTGRDIGLLIRAKSMNSPENVIQKPNFKKKFGALELAALAAPHIEWSDMYGDNGKQKKDITVKYYPDERSYRIESSGRDPKIETNTWYNLVSEPLIKPLSLPATERESLSNLLEKLGFNRIARLNFEGVLKKKENLRGSINNIGMRLGDIIALLYDIYQMKGVVVAGGLMSDEMIAESCMAGLRKALEPYLYDTFFGKDGFVVKQLTDDAEKRTPEEILQKSKVIIYRTGQNSALLGAAILGFDHYIVTQKIKELQEIAKDKPRTVEEKIQFLTKKEAIKFLKHNSVQLRVTISDEGEISSIES